MAEIRAIEVRIWHRQVGALAPLRGKPGFYEFQYASFARGLELSPLKVAHPTKRYSFRLADEPFTGFRLVGCASGPVGNALIDEYPFATDAPRDITSLQRLAYVGQGDGVGLSRLPAVNRGAAVPRRGHLVGTRRLAK
jgi:serine/threonine-protein kinase HipA